MFGGNSYARVFGALALTLFTSAAGAEKAIAVSCLGKFWPEGGVIRVAAPYALQGPSIIRELKIKEGDWVEACQALATTHNRAAMQAAVTVAEARSLVAKRRLELVQAGQKPADVAAQTAEMQRQEVELAFREGEFNRREKLFNSAALSAAELDRSRADLQAQKRQLEFDRERLKSVAEVRGVDVELAKAQLQEAEADLARSRAELEQTEVRAPVAGQVLKISARPGEETSKAAILEMANTRSILVHAEVYETDAARVQVGQRAEITGASFTGKLTGAVESVGWRVERNGILPSDQAAYANLRVVEVKIRLAGEPKQRLLINAEVAVRIFP